MYTPVFPSLLGKAQGLIYNQFHLAYFNFKLIYETSFTIKGLRFFQF
jgi:hypothetical protein